MWDGKPKCNAQCERYYACNGGMESQSVMLSVKDIMLVMVGWKAKV